MTDRTEDLLDPIGSDAGDIDVEPTQPRGDTDHATSQDVTRETEQHGGALRVVTLTQPGQDTTAEEGDNPQPTSAFSFSSSDEDAEADDEGAGEIEEDEDDDDEDGQSSVSSDIQLIGTDNRPDKDRQSNESRETQLDGTKYLREEVVSPLQQPSSPFETLEGDVSPLEQPPSPVPQPIYAAPAVRGIPHSDDADYELYRSVGYQHWTYYHDQSSSSSEERKQKRKKTREAPPGSLAARPSPLRTTSSPDSPVSPKDQAVLAALMAGDIGVLPEPSPVLENESMSELGSDRDSTPKPESQQARRKSATSFDWSEDEDEEDTSWVQDAVEQLTSSRRAYEVNAADVLPETDNQTREDISDEADNHESRGSGISTPASDSDSSSSLKHTIHNHGRSFGFHLTTETEASNADTRPPTPEDTPASEGQAPVDDVSAPENFAPVFDGAEDEIPLDVTSPTPDGPEPLTGLTPQQGLFVWWNWVSRTKRDQFITNRHSDDEGSSGDFGKTVRSKDRSNASAYLRKQRLELKSGDQYGIVDVQLKDEELLEYARFQMLRYRAQRNQYYDEARSNQDRVGRRNRTIWELEQQLEAYKSTCESSTAQLEELGYLVDRCQTAEEGYDKERERRKQLQDELQKLNGELKRTQMFSGQYQKAAEANAHLARLQRAKQNEELSISSVMTSYSEGPNGISSETAATASGRFVTELDHRRSRVPTPAPEQLVHWPVDDRARLAVYMAEWINAHPEQESSDHPISEATLQVILAREPMTWDSFIQELNDAGYIIRPDHFAQALSNSEAIQAGSIPRPSLAVMYAARRLNDGTAVRDLLQEVADMEEALENAESQGSLLRLHELEDELQMLGSAQPGDLAEQIEELKERLIDRDEQIMVLHQDLEAAEITEQQYMASQKMPGKNSKELQQIVNDFVKSTQKETDTGKAVSALEAKLAACQMHGRQMLTRIDDLLQKLNDMGEECQSRTKRSSDLEAKIHEFEKERSALHSQRDADNSNPAKLESEIEELRSQSAQKLGMQGDKHFTCRKHSATLQSRIDELELELEKLQRTGQANETLPSDLSDRLRASEQHVADLQAIIDEQQRNLNEANKSFATAESVLAQAELARDQFSNEIDELKLELATARSHRQRASEDEPNVSQRESVANQKHPQTVSEDGFGPDFGDAMSQEQAEQTDTRSYELPWPKPTRLSPVWQERETKMRFSQSFVEDEEKRKMAREQRQRQELESLDWIQRRIGELCGMEEMAYVPLEEIFVATVL